MGNYLRAGEVADILNVSPKTIARWANEGRLPYMHTLGRHKRYPEDKIRELAAGLQANPQPEPEPAR